MSENLQFDLAADEAKESESRRQEKKAEFHNLNEKHSKALSEFIKNKKELFKSHKGDEEEVRRMKTRLNFYLILIEAIEECKQNNEEDPEKYEEFESLSDIKINKDLSFDNADKLASSFANFIEVSTYKMAKEEIDEVYHKRIILIYSTIKNIHNRDFVKKILSQDIDVDDLATMSADELLGDDIKQRREIIEENIIKEKLLIHDSLTVVSKSHKGEEVIEVCNEAKVTQSDDGEADDEANRSPSKNKKSEDFESKSGAAVALLRRAEVNTLSEVEQHEEEQIILSGVIIKNISKKIEERIDQIVHNVDANAKLKDILSKIPDEESFKTLAV